jgi:beta-glucosidase-like glycosyl hydrolase
MPMEKEHDILTPEIRFHLIRKMERHKVIALAGPRLLPHERKYLEFHSVAGIILFSRNIESLSQVGELIDSVCEELQRDGQAPLIMADHEGDFVAELKQVIGVPPSLLAIAATGDIDLATQVAFETGNAMKKMGVNTVLAPVADCYFERGSAITGLRTFGADPRRVAAFVEQTIAGYRASGVLCCAKHFPGHGATDEDSHETMPEVRKSAEDLSGTDLVPFRAAIAAGADMMMMSHIAYPLEREGLIPASFDSRLIRTMLRGELGYDGVVITDALEMAGARWYTSERSGMVSGGNERSLLAGADLLLHTRPIPEHVQVEQGSEPVMSINVMETIVRTLERIVDRERIGRSHRRRQGRHQRHPRPHGGADHLGDGVRPPVRPEPVHRRAARRGRSREPGHLGLGHRRRSRHGVAHRGLRRPGHHGAQAGGGAHPAARVGSGARGARDRQPH